jgi:exodeoxyribonuclease VII large subunit
MLHNAGEKTGRLESSLRHLDPVSVLGRGFTLTTRDGKILHSSSDIVPGDTLITHFEHGKASSIVTETTKKK